MTEQAEARRDKMTESLPQKESRMKSTRAVRDITTRAGSKSRYHIALRACANTPRPDGSLHLTACLLPGREGDLEDDRETREVANAYLHSSPAVV